MSLPKISCLTITKDRLKHVPTAINNFARQNYPNKEHIIVTHGNADFYKALQQIIAEYPAHTIKLIQTPESDCSLGWLRNQTVAAATGEIICQWDDDDWYHPERLTIQYQAMLKQNVKACVFSDVLFYFAKKKELYWVDWPSNHLDTQGLPFTLMAYKSVMPSYAEAGKYSCMGEDADLFKRLAQTQSIAIVSGQGQHYVYCCHDSNTSSYIDKLSVVVCGTIPIHLFTHLEQRLTAALKYYPLPDDLKINWHEAGALFKYHNGLTV